MSANDNFSLHDDEELSLHDDASLDGSIPASNKGDAPAKPPQIITTNTLSNIKLPVLQKDDYDTWAMEMEHYLEYIDNEVWKVIQNGNSKKRVTKGKDGVYRVLPPTTQEEQFADEKERKARTLLLMAVPKDHLRRFHGMDDAKEIWAAIKTRFGGNANSKKMQKAVLKQQFEAFTISSKESLEKGSKEGNRQEAGRGQDFKPVRTEKEALMTIDEGQINWVEQTTDEELNHALMAFTVNNEVSMCSKLCLDTYNALQAKYDELQSEFGDQEAALVAHKLAVKKLESQLKASHKQQSSLNEKLNFQANQIFEKDEKLKKYRRIGMKAVKDKDALQKIVDSWFASSKNLWKLIDCGMSSTVKLGLGHSIKSNAEVLGYEEEMSRGIFVLRETDEGYYDIPLYSRFKQVEYKGVPPPLSGDYTPRAQEDIDDSLYVYGKHGPQPQSPSPTVSNASSIVFSICPSNDSDGELGVVCDASSTHYSTCQSNDSDGELGTVTDHSVNDDSIPIPSSEQVSISTQKTQSQVPTPPQTVDPSCAQHVKTPRQPIRTPVTPSPISSYNRQNWNQRMERELGAGYSFVRKPCFVCGSLSHLIKDCDYYEKKMAREAALKSKRVIHVDARQARPAWTNTNRVNKANQFTPRPVQLSNLRPNFSTASRTIKTGRVNVNTGKQNVSSGSKHVNAGSVHFNSGTQFKSGASRFNTGKQHVNSGRMYVNSGTQNKSGGSRVNTGKQNVNTARVNRPVLSNQTSQVNLKSPKKCFSKQSSPVNRPFSRNTAYKSNIYAVKGKMGTAVKTSAGCVWRKTTPHSNTNSGPTPDSYVHDHPLKHMEHRGIFDSGCSGHMTGNRAHLEDYQELSKVGSVTFGGSKGSISGKDMLIKSLNVLFTEKECFVVSLTSKMPDENQKQLILLAIPSTGPLGKFDGKSDEGFLVGYSVNSKAFRVYNLVTKRVEVNLHVNFLEEKPNVQGIGHRWMFDLDYLTDSMNYIPVSLQNQANPAGSKEVIDIDVQTEEDADLMVVSSTSLSEKIATKKTHSPRQPSSTPISKSADDIMTFRKELDALALKHLGPVPTTVPTSTNPVNTGGSNLNTAFEEVNTGNTEAISPSADHEAEVFSDADDDEMPEIRIYDKSSEAHQEAIIEINNIVLFACFLSQFEPRKSSQKPLKMDFKLVEAMQEELNIKGCEGEELSYQVYKYADQGMIFISQDKYVAEILKKFDLVNVKAAITPMETKLPLTKDEEAFDVDVHLYRSMIGSLMYLTASRPDIMYAVCVCSRFQVTPKTSHLNAVKRIFKYLKGKPNLGLWYPRESPLDLEAFSDSDYGGSNLDRKSTTGGCQFLGQRLISWQCKKQTIVATSTTEAEYVAAANCCGQVLWVQNQLLDYGFNFMNTKIHIDNESTICIVKNPVYHSKTKHIEIRHHFIRDCYEKKLISVEKIHTDLNVADLLTKPFDGPRFNYLVVSIGMINP
ncbi:hypothetical protein Tco_1368145 [Tanacetum coccineum]